MQLVEGYQPIKTSLRLLPLAVGATLASMLAPWLAQKLGACLVLAGGIAVPGIGILLLAGATAVYALTPRDTDITVQAHH
ncbi:hypothetical protein [Nocardia sp. AG03]|uniref:hypothetical protein n=1 Tax=Nocardia sp. AG03 TaxID=3025312 RepID=UPI002418ABFC|nr:hypothetical protein [Nocardia sp. AG03]